MRTETASREIQCCKVSNEMQSQFEDTLCTCEETSFECIRKATANMTDGTMHVLVLPQFPVCTRFEVHSFLLSSKHVLGWCTARR